nr:unnamed protein product [Callosobruchus chinensis]
MEKRLLAMEMGYWRRCCKLTLLDKVRNEQIRDRMSIATTIIDTIEAKKLRWYGHVCRMENSRWPKRILNWNPPERRRRGRPRTSWRDGLESAMRERDLNPGDWRDRKRWKLG